MIQTVHIHRSKAEVQGRQAEVESGFLPGGSAGGFRFWPSEETWPTLLCSRSNQQATSELRETPSLFGGNIMFPWYECKYYKFNSTVLKDEVLCVWLLHFSEDCRYSYHF